MTTKIKVLQVIPKLGYGGAETGCYDLAHYLAEKDCGSFIATSGGQLLKFIKKNSKLVLFDNNSNIIGMGLIISLVTIIIIELFNLLFGFLSLGNMRFISYFVIKYFINFF